MGQNRLLIAGLFFVIALANAGLVSAQAYYTWNRYTISGYGAVDVGYRCQDSTLEIALHGEAQGGFLFSFNGYHTQLGFFGSSSIGPNGYYDQKIYSQYNVDCSDRTTWAPLGLSSVGGSMLQFNW